MFAVQDCVSREEVQPLKAENPPAGGWPGEITIARQWGQTGMRERAHPECTLIHPPVCATIAEDEHLAPRALESLCSGSNVDLVLTDPPYGIGYQSGMARPGRRKQAIEKDATDEYEPFLSRALPVIKALMKRGAVMYWFAGGGGGEPVLAKALLAISKHFTLLNTLVWDKVDAGLGWRWRRSWEAIMEASNGKPAAWYGGTEKRNVLPYPKAIPQADDHPTPKPVPLLEEHIQASAPRRAVILDPFAGSGSTLIAAERTGRTCFAVELEPRYCDIVVARWEALSDAKAARIRC